MGDNYLDVLLIIMDVLFTMYNIYILYIYGPIVHLIMVHDFNDKLGMSIFKINIFVWSKSY